MTGVSRQKQKLLTMKKLFETKTDEKHTITGNRLIEILGDYGIKAERKTIYDDIKTLCDIGMDIEITKDGHSNAVSGRGAVCSCRRSCFKQVSYTEEIEGAVKEDTITYI